MVAQTEGQSVVPPPTRRVSYYRHRPAFEWPGVFENYSKGFVKREFWRVQYVLGTEQDALQQCGLVFARCLNHYGHICNNPRWFMGLYQRALAAEWNTLSLRDSRARSIPVPEDAESEENNAGFLSACLAKGSSELKELVLALATAPAEFLTLLLAVEPGPRFDERLNRRICRLLRISNPATDIVSELRAILD